jgi:hypothetical protein
MWSVSLHQCQVLLFCVQIRINYHFGVIVLTSRRSNNQHPLSIEIDQLKKSGNMAAFPELITKFLAVPTQQRRNGELLCEMFTVSGAIKIFLNDETWRNSITVEELNALDADGDGALKMLAQYQEVKKKSSQLRAKELSFRPGQELAEEAGIHNLHELLAIDHGFRKKITASAFCAMDEEGYSAARYTFRRYQAMDLLVKYPDMRMKLTAAFLNHRPSFDEMPFLFRLLIEEKEAVFSDPMMRDLISAKGLNTLSAFRSALFLLSKDEETIGLFADANLLGKASKKTLNTLSESDGLSVVRNFVQSPTGRHIMLESRKFIRKINAAAFNAQDRNGISPFFLLLQTEEGLAMLAKYRHLRDLINIDSLNRECRHGVHKGLTPLYLLLSTQAGRDILMQMRHLPSMIEVGDLYSRPEGSDITIAHLLAAPAAADVLRRLSKDVQARVPELIQQIENMKAARQSKLGMFAPQPSQLEPVETVAEKTEKRCVIL